MRFHLAGPLIAIAVVMTPASGQHVGYVSLRDREIKALGTDEIQVLLEGEGMAQALAAELNGYPGPRHVLELADSLDLSAEQRHSADSLFHAMREEARRMGRAIVEAERALDSAFANQVITEAALVSHLTRLGDLRGRLRYVHLRSHLSMRAALTEHQVQRYNQIRGYQTDAHPHGGHEPPAP